MSQFPPRACIRMAAELEKAETNIATTDPPHQGELRFLSLRDVLDRLTISQPLLYELIKDPAQPFPAPVHIGRRNLRVAGEVESYMHSAIASARARQLSRTPLIFRYRGLEPVGCEPAGRATRSREGLPRVT